MFLLLLACATAAAPRPSAPPPAAAPSPAAAPPPAAAPSPAAGAPPSAPPHVWPAPERLVAIGDLHGDVASAILALKLGGLVDDAGQWTGGSSWLVQTGDILDRGKDGATMLDFLGRLEAGSAAAGGKAIFLNGNHELMNLQGDWRYVADLADFPGANDEERSASRRAYFSASGPAGPGAGATWVMNHQPTVQVGATVFAHGGIDSNWASRGIAGINTLVAAAWADPKAPVLGPDGPLWNRAYLLGDPPAVCPELDRALRALGASRMVVGHTTQDSGRIASRCEGKLYGIDTGISAHYGMHPSALVILRNADGSETVTTLP